MALFSAANGLRMIVMFLPNMFSRVTAPLMNGVLANGDSRLYRRTFHLNLLLSSVSAAIGGLVMVWGGSYILGLFGKDFRDPGGVVFVLMAATTVEAVANSLYQALFSHGRLWLQVIVILAWSISLIAAASLLTRYGALGLACAFLAAWLLSTALYAALAFWLHARHSNAPICAGLAAETPRHTTLPVRIAISYLEDS
jgi:O-antigen/teichoic acid export membrane protein